MKKISEIITYSIAPNPTYLINTRAIYEEDKVIIEVEVKKGKSLFYINKYGRSSKGCYIRVGTTCRSMSEEQIEKEFIKSIDLPKYRLINDRSPIQQLTFRVFKIYLDEKNVFYDEKSFNNRRHSGHRRRVRQKIRLGRLLGCLCL